MASANEDESFKTRKTLKQADRRRSQTNHANMGHANTAPPCNVFGLALFVKGNNHGHGHGQHGQREKLTEHTGVERCRLLPEMATAMMVYALSARLFSGLLLMMNVKGREKQHWHEYGQ